MSRNEKLIQKLKEEAFVNENPIKVFVKKYNDGNNKKFRIHYYDHKRGITCNASGIPSFSDAMEYASANLLNYQNINYLVQ